MSSRRTQGKPIDPNAGDPDRFYDKVEIPADPTACWRWQAALSDGYGSIGWGGSVVKAHRLSYALHNGPLDPELEVDHMCRNRACVNPGHLQQVSRRLNVENVGIRSDNRSGYRGVSRARGCADDTRWRARVRKSGHEYSFGIFDNIEDAAEAARAGRMQLETNNLADRRTAERKAEK